ncbi:MAG TPA: cation diffusion facilitator family transporter [Micromonosporaceae bacterium]
MADTGGHGGAPQRAAPSGHGGAPQRAVPGGHGDPGERGAAVRRAGEGDGTDTGGGDPASTRTVLIAAGANLAIALAKGVAALFTGSAALWAETLHSVADTGNEVLLFVGLRRSTREPDRTHPFGYGQERYFWAFLAALGIFLVGGVLSIAEGVRDLLVPEPLRSPWVGIGVLVVSAGFEAYSWNTARRQLREEARSRQRTLVEQLNRVSDPSASTVYLEDSAALIGIALALLGVVLDTVTGQVFWDAAASVCIGLLLMVVAWLLARRSKALLTDESAPPDVLDRVTALLAGFPDVAEIREVQAVYMGPSQLMVAAWVRLPADVVAGSAGDALRAVRRIRAHLLSHPRITEAAVLVVDPDGTDDAPVEPNADRTSTTP